MRRQHANETYVAYEAACLWDDAMDFNEENRDLREIDVSNHAFCRLLLAGARNDAFDIPTGLHAWKAPFDTFEVRDGAGNLVWAGKACCAWEARAHAIGAHAKAQP